MVTVNVTGRADPARWARKLLDSEIARSAAWPSETAVRVSSRLRKTGNDMRRLREAYRMMVRAESEGTWRSAMKFALHSPRFGLRYLRAKWVRETVLPWATRFADEPSTRRLASLFLRHPLFTILHVLPGIRLARGKDGENAEPAAADDDEITVVTGAEDVAGLEGAEEESDLAATIMKAETIFLEQQVVSAGIRLSDSHLFAGPDRDDDGFVRLMLRNSYHHFVLPGSDEELYVVFEPRLLIHDSGILQLDLTIRAHGASLDVRQALALAWGPEAMFVRSRMSSPLLAGTSWESLADYSAGDIDVGFPLGTLEYSSPVSMTDLLSLHLEAIQAIIKRSYGMWINYPVSILEVGGCCPSDSWKEMHRDDLFRLVSRGSVNRDVSPHVLIPKDLSGSASHSLYSTIASATYLQWTGDSPVGMAELDTVLLYEYAMLQYMRLHALEEDLSRMRLRDRTLRKHYKRAIRLFSEVRQRDLRSGETREIVDFLLRDLGAPEIRRTIETALDLSSSAYATVSAERSARRAQWLTLAATAIALLVAVPPLRDLLDAVPPREAGEPWVLGILRGIQKQDFWGPWIIVGAVLVSVLGLRSLSYAWRHRPTRIPSIRRGYKWPTEFKVSTTGSSPSAEGPRSTVLTADLSEWLARDPDGSQAPPDLREP